MELLALLEAAETARNYVTKQILPLRDLEEDAVVAKYPSWPHLHSSCCRSKVRATRQRCGAGAGLCCCIRVVAGRVTGSRRLMQSHCLPQFQLSLRSSPLAEVLFDDEFPFESAVPFAPAAARFAANPLADE